MITNVLMLYISLIWCRNSCFRTLILILILVTQSRGTDWELTGLVRKLIALELMLIMNRQLTVLMSRLRLLILKVSLVILITWQVPGTWIKIIETTHQRHIELILHWRFQIILLRKADLSVIGLSTNCGCRIILDCCRCKAHIVWNGNWSSFRKQIRLALWVRAIFQNWILP